ncbi:MAG: hypothetical protein KAV00_06850 [Phycisphaerae bacterium]|nr:hypothetical protein [Phycisphaerae bacterium]
MAETTLTNAQAEALQNTTPSLQDFEYGNPGENYEHKGIRQQQRLLSMSAVSDAGRVFKDGALTYGVRAIQWYNGDTLVTKAQTDTQALTDDATNYIYYTVSGTLTKNTTGFPIPSVTAHIQLATILTASGAYAYTAITDKRQSGFITALGAEAIQEISIYNSTGAQIGAGELLHIKGWNAANSCYDVELADADTVNKPAQLVATANIANSAVGVAADVYDLTGQNTDAAGAVGDAVYLSTTAGGWTLTKPTGADQIGQEIGYVTVKHASTGAIRFIVSLAGNRETVGTTGIADLAITNAKLAGDVTRAKMIEESLVRYQISLMQCRNANGTVMDATGGAGKFYLDADAWGDGTLVIISEESNDSIDRTDTLSFEFCLPPEYVAASDLELNIHAKDSGFMGSPSDTRTIDAEVYELTDAGAVGADLVDVGDTAQTLTTSFADYSFTIDGSGLLAGDRLRVLVQCVVNDAVAGEISIGSIEMQLDIKG